MGLEQPSKSSISGSGKTEEPFLDFAVTDPKEIQERYKITPPNYPLFQDGEWRVISDELRMNISLEEWKEKKGIADQYKIFDPATLAKNEKGEWCKDGVSVKQWAEIMAEDDSQYRYGHH